MTFINGLIVALLASAMPAKPEPEVEAVEVAPKLEEPPVFKARWWYSSERLDARPVIWSLDHRAHEWGVDFPGTSYETLRHKPSRHEMYSGRGMLKGMMQAECSCSGRPWQLGQRKAVCQAIDRWRAAHGVDGRSLSEQFSAHFISFGDHR